MVVSHVHGEFDLKELTTAMLTRGRSSYFSLQFLDIHVSRVSSMPRKGPRLICHISSTIGPCYLELPAIMSEKFFFLGFGHIFFLHNFTVKITLL